MNNRVPLAIKLTLIALLITGSCVYVQAQKKEIQTTNLLAPDVVKIDGKLTEWGFDFQAYNKTTKLYYTMANDGKNLYLVVKSKDNINTNKILGGGISLSINTADKKKDKDAFVITFPLPNRTSMRGLRGNRGGGNPNPQNLTPAQIDSATKESHKAALGMIREMSVLGFKDITDTVISIYNEYSIKAAAGFDEENSFIFELAVPLKLLSLSADNPKEFAYNIKVNGIQTGRTPGGGGRGGPGGGPGAGGGLGDGGEGGGFGGRGGGGGGRGGGGGGGFGGGGGGRGGGGFGGGGSNSGITTMEEMTTATDFWGKYTLAKK